MSGRFTGDFGLVVARWTLAAMSLQLIAPTGLVLCINPGRGVALETASASGDCDGCGESDSAPTAEAATGLRTSHAGDGADRCLDVALTPRKLTASAARSLKIRIGGAPFIAPPAALAAIFAAAIDERASREIVPRSPDARSLRRSVVLLV